MRFTSALLLLSASASAHNPELDASYSGTWFNPGRSGEGWMIQFVDESTVVIDWLTYPAAGEGGPQAWIFGVGTVDQSRIVIDEAFTVEGLNFNSPVAAGEIPLTPWGSYTIEFVDCTTAVVDYAGRDAYGSDQIAINRLSSVAGLNCGDHHGRKVLAGDELSEQAAPGSWVDPERLGQGWLLENSGNGLTLMTWFTHRNGLPAWLFGQGFFDGKTLTMFDVVITEGGTFGPSFDPSAVVRINWGDLQMRFDGCDSGQMLYRSNLEDFAHGEFRFERATSIAGLDCEPLASSRGPALVNGSWRRAGDLPTTRSEVAVTAMDGKAYVFGGFGSNTRAFERFDPVTQTWEILADAPSGRDHAMLAAHQGKVYLFGGSGQQIFFNYIYDPETDRWDRIADMPSVKIAGAAVSLGNRIYLVGGGGLRSEVLEPLTYRYDPATDTFETLAPPPPAGRDHSNAVAYEGEVWLMGGRDTGGGHNRVAIFNPVTQAWRTGPALLDNHTGYAAMVMDGQIFVAGGEDFIPNVPNSIRTLATFGVYSPESGWVRGPDLPQAVHGVQGVGIDGVIYLFGGATVPGAPDPGPTGVQVYVP